MAEQRQDDQLEPTYTSSVPIRDVALKTCRKQWTMGRSGERGSGISVLMALHDDGDCFFIIPAIQQYIHFSVLLSIFVYIEITHQSLLYICSHQPIPLAWTHENIILYSVNISYIHLINRIKPQLKLFSNFLIPRIKNENYLCPFYFDLTQIEEIKLGLVYIVLMIYEDHPITGQI